MLPVADRLSTDVLLDHSDPPGRCGRGGREEVHFRAGKPGGGQWGGEEVGGVCG